MNLQLRNSLLSILLLAALVLLVYFLMIYGSKNKFAIIWFYITWYIAVIISLIAALYFMWNYKAVSAQSQHGFGYNFTGTLNWASGITGFLLAENTGAWLVVIMLNCIIGFYMYKEIYCTKAGAY